MGQTIVYQETELQISGFQFPATVLLALNNNSLFLLSFFIRAQFDYVLSLENAIMK